MRTMKTEGIGSFWRGNMANVIRYFPTQALNFAFKDTVKSLFKTAKDAPQYEKFGKNILSGGVAGSLSLTFVYSLDYCRTRLANDAKSKTGTRQYNGMIDVYVKTIKSDGIQGLYRGFVISCVGIFIYRGMYFGLYDSIKPIVLGDNASVFVWMMTSGQAVKYKNSMDCAMQVLKNEGFMSLMKGAGANILRGVAGAGVLAGFDKFKELYIAFRLG